MFSLIEEAHKIQNIDLLFEKLIKHYSKNYMSMLLKRWKFDCIGCNLFLVKMVIYIVVKLIIQILCQ